MTERKTIGITTLITMGIVLISMITPNFFDTPKYYCEYESSIMECSGGLSGDLGTRCYLNTEKNSWDYCRSGWIEISDDRPIQEEPEEYIKPSEPEIIETPMRISCNKEGCVEI